MPYTYTEDKFDTTGFSRNTRTNMLGEHFVNKCLENAVSNDPYPHQYFANTLPEDSFKKLRDSLANVDTSTMTRHSQMMDWVESITGKRGPKDIAKLQADAKEWNMALYVRPKQFKKYGIDFYDETMDIAEAVFNNAKALCDQYPKFKLDYKNLGITAWIGITPPFPNKFAIHNDPAAWSSVTYIFPEEQTGTPLYVENEVIKESPYSATHMLDTNSKFNSHEEKFTFVKEAQWVPNSSLIFADEPGSIWHSRANNGRTFRFSFCLSLSNSGKNHNNCLFS